MAFEHHDDSCEIHERPAQVIDLIHHHAVDLTGLDIGDKPLDRRALHVLAREAAVVVPVR